MDIHLPLMQRFDCHSCGYCCRELVVNVTDEERRRILDAGWAERLGGQPLFESYRYGGKTHHRLAHRPGGGCVFLGADGMCRIHAETGIGAKPLACRLYPFVPTPAGDAIRLDLRSDCPSVAGNRGRPLTVHQREVEAFVRELGLVPTTRLPGWAGQRGLSTRELDCLVAAFDGFLGRGGTAYRTRLAVGCHLLDLLYQVELGKVRDQRFIELIEMLSEAAWREAAPDDREAPALSNRMNVLFRQWVFLHALSDDVAALQAGWVRRLARSQVRYWQARRFTRGRGAVPRLRPDWPAASFEVIESVEAADDDALEPLCRSMRVKLQAHAFMGAGYFGYDVLSGLTALWLTPGLVGWFARLEAVRQGREALTADDVLAGVRQVHHAYGVSPVFSQTSERLRLRALSKPGVPAAVLGRYGP